MRTVWQPGSHTAAEALEPWTVAGGVEICRAQVRRTAEAAEQAAEFAQSRGDEALARAQEGLAAVQALDAGRPAERAAASKLLEPHLAKLTTAVCAE